MIGSNGFIYCYNKPFEKWNTFKGTNLRKIKLFHRTSIITSLRNFSHISKIYRFKTKMSVRVIFLRDARFFSNVSRISWLGLNFKEEVKKKKTTSLSKRSGHSEKKRRHLKINSFKIRKTGSQKEKSGHSKKKKKTGHIYPPRRVIGSDSLATNRIFGSLWNKTKKPDVTLKRSGHFEIKRTSPLKGRRLDIFFQKSSNLWKKSFNSLLWRVWGTFSARLDFS